MGRPKLSRVGELLILAVLVASISEVFWFRAGKGDGSRCLLIHALNTIAQRPSLVGFATCTAAP